MLHPLHDDVLPLHKLALLDRGQEAFLAGTADKHNDHGRRTRPRQTARRTVHPKKSTWQCQYDSGRHSRRSRGIAPQGYQSSDWRCELQEHAFLQG